MKPSQKALEAQAFNQGALLVAYAVVVAIFVLSDGIAHTVAYWMLMGAVGVHILEFMLMYKSVMQPDTVRALRLSLPHIKPHRIQFGDASLARIHRRGVALSISC